MNWLRPQRSLVTSISCILLITLANLTARLGCGEEAVHICRYCEVLERTAKQAAVVEDGLSGTRRRYAPDREVDVLHIQLDVTPHFEARTISGTTTIRFAPIARPATELRLHSVHLTIADVRSSARLERFAASDEELTIVFAEPIPAGQEAWIEVDHTAQPTRGFYFRTPDMGYPESDTHVWTQGETHEARHWFPCFDYPNERSTTEVICHVPRGMTVLSNGRQMDESCDEATQLKSVRWLQDKPHASYLICLVAGYFDKLETAHARVPLAFFTQPSLFEHAANSFADTASIMDFFEGEIGVPFPWDKYYQVTIRDFTAGGMENTSLTTLTHNSIFSQQTENIRSARTLDAHEMAHQWFGDLVTCKDWSHLWLNEGFATYYSHLYEGHKFGRDALLYGLYRDATQRVLPRGAKDKRPIVYKEYDGPGEQFDFRAYPKGSWVLHMLRSQLGETLYRECIRTYLERHALTSVVTEELNAVVEELSGCCFDPFFDQWVYHGGHPALQIDYRWLPREKRAHVTVRQTQTVDDDVLLFQFPTQLRFILDGGQVIDRDLEITQARHEVHVPLPAAPRIVRFDPELSVLAEIEFKKSDDLLLAQLENQADVIGRLRTVDDLGRRSTHRVVQALQQTLQHDDFYGVRQAAAQALRRMGTDEAFEALHASRSQPDARVRLTVVECLGRFYRPEARQALLDVAREEANPAIASAALSALGKYQQPEVTEVLRQSLHSQSFRNELALAAVSALGDQADPTSVGPLLAVLQERHAEFPTRGLAVRAARLGQTQSCSRPTARRPRLSPAIRRRPQLATAVRRHSSLGSPGGSDFQGPARNAGG